MSKKFTIPILAWLKNEQCITFNKNIIHAEKAFFISSVIKWCIKERENKELSDSRVNKYLRLIKQYLNEDLDLYWEGGKIVISLSQEEKPNDDNDKEESGN